MRERRPPVFPKILIVWFLAGIAFGALAGLLMLTPNSDQGALGIVREVVLPLGWLALVLVGLAMWNLQVSPAYADLVPFAALAVGCILNGLLFAAIGEGLRRVTVFVRSKQSSGDAKP